MFNGIFDSDLTRVISVGDFLLCLGASLLLGILLSLSYLYRTRCTKSFLLTLGLLPAVVCVVIMMVNGNVGAGVAVAGAFSLVRFRSVPGTAREIVALFLAMGTGLITGMGYLAFGALFTLIMCVILLLFNHFSLAVGQAAMRHKVLNVTIPEDLDYTDVFADILQAYTTSFELVRVKTTNMGSMFRLTYHITLRDPQGEKEMIDKLRCRNGNLEISLSRQESGVAEL